LEVLVTFAQYFSQATNGIKTFRFLNYLLTDDLINPVKMSVGEYVPSVPPSVQTSMMKHNAATNQIVVFVKVDQTFTMIWLSRSSEVRIKITWDLNFQK